MSKEGIYIAKKTINHNSNLDQGEWIQIPRTNKNNTKRKKTYSYEDNLKKKIERKKKNYLYKINRNKKELDKYVTENSLFIKSRLDEGFLIEDSELKQDVNQKLDIMEKNLETAHSSDNLKEFLIYSEKVKDSIKYVNSKINKSNFTELILANKISNVNKSLLDKIKNKQAKPVQVIPKLWRKIEPGISFADMLKK